MPYFPSLNQYNQPVSYMITVDGENAAKMWQPPTAVQPNMIIPIFDSDGVHVYFKTYDMYGRMNPIQKGTIVFEKETTDEPKTEYASIDDVNQIRDDIASIKEMIMGLTNQNGSKTKAVKTGEQVAKQT